MQPLAIFSGIGLALIARRPPAGRLLTVLREQAIVHAVHDHHRKRSRAFVITQILRIDSCCARCNRLGNMFGAGHKRQGHRSSTAVGMPGKKNAFFINTPLFGNQAWNSAELDGRGRR